MQGIICPKFSFFWAILGAIYYFFIHPYILEALMWLSKNPVFSFVIGMFYGIFIIDVVYSANLMIKFKKFAKENKVIVKIEAVKVRIITLREESRKKYSLFRPFYTEIPLSEFLKNMKETFEIKKKK